MKLFILAIALIVAAIVFYAGGTALVESVKKIIWPETPDYSIVSIIIIAAAVLVKIGLSIFFRIQGKKVNSSALTASGADAFFDAVLSASVLLSAIVYMIWHVSLEAYVGIIISAFIIKAAIEMILDSLKDILGTRPDPELSVKIKTIITKATMETGISEQAVRRVKGGKPLPTTSLQQR